MMEVDEKIVAVKKYSKKVRPVLLL
ncbi:MAG: hypothetical protein ACJ76H_00775 [Bacteriovoracaceae bacterium]